MSRSFLSVAYQALALFHCFIGLLASFDGDPLKATAYYGAALTYILISEHYR